MSHLTRRNLTIFKDMGISLEPNMIEHLCPNHINDHRLGMLPLTQLVHDQHRIVKRVQPSKLNEVGEKMMYLLNELTSIEEMVPIFNLMLTKHTTSITLPKNSILGRDPILENAINIKHYEGRLYTYTIEPFRQV